MFYRFLFFFEILNGVVLIAALLSRKDNHKANVFLVGVIAAVLYSEWVRFLVVTGDIALFPYFLRSAFPGTLLVPVLFYFYTLALTTPDFEFRKCNKWHFLPFAFAMLWYVLVLIFGRSLGFWEWPRRHPMEQYLKTVIAVFIYGAYWFASFSELKRYQEKLKDYFSEFRRVRLLWLRNLLILLTLPWLIGLLDVVTGPYVTFERWMIPTVAFVILMMGFFGYRQSVIFAPDLEWEGPKPAPVSQAFFTLEELEGWKKRLEQYAQEKKPYLNPDLRLTDLARGLKLKPYQVSEVLNRGIGITFYEFINRLRVGEVLKNLADPAYSHYSLLGVAMESGFNSKSVFNDAFRKIMGVTPSQYRETRQAS